MWKICIGEVKFTEIYRIITVHDLLQSISSDPFVGKYKVCID